MFNIKRILSKVLGDPNEKAVKELRPQVEEINALEPEFERMSTADLRAMTEEFRGRIVAARGALPEELANLKTEIDRAEGFVERDNLQTEYNKIESRMLDNEEEVLLEILPRAFAAVREAAKRTIGQRHYDVQLLGGMFLHQGTVVEMKTGEGKTLTSTLPLYLNALAGHGAHLITPNDYLAKRDCQWMGPIYHLLGLEVGVIQAAGAAGDLRAFLFDPDYPSTDDRYQNLRPCTRQAAYTADITYGTNNEFGFDYLRDNMVWELDKCVQSDLHYAIVDEVDNILIDEARTPLIISGPAEKSSDNYRKFAELTRSLRSEVDYTIDEKDRVVTLTETGIANVEYRLGIDNLYSPENFELTPYMDNALKAQALFHRDDDYILQNGEVIIVDDFTGRLMYGRRYSEGLHQAIEAKEGVKIQRESMTWATITLQNYFRMYTKLAGMTGTAATEEEEFFKIYELEVRVLPTNVEYRAQQGELETHTRNEDSTEIVTYHDPTNPEITLYKRIDYPDVIYKSTEAKYHAVVDEIEHLHKGQVPVLLGTVSVEKSEYISNQLDRRGIPHNVLNAKQHEKEAVIIAQAGRPGAVTLATNMAGRGVDILLGGNPEGLAREELRKKGKDLTEVEPEEWDKVFNIAAAECARDKKIVWERGGLCVIGTERHEARRIDNQLRGRAGRQGDPGSSRFYISLEDDLMRRFGKLEMVANLMDQLGEDMPIEHGLISKTIENAQTRVEGHNFDIRKHLLEYDDVINKQREVIYKQRRRVLSQQNLRPTIMEMIEEEIRGLVTIYGGDQYEEGRDLRTLQTEIRKIMPLKPTETEARWAEMDSESLTEHLSKIAQELYDLKETQINNRVDLQDQELEQPMHQLERVVMLRAVDTLWVRHLTSLDELRQGIGLRAYGQQDPLVSYRKEAHEMFQDLMGSIRSQIVHTIYHTDFRPQAAPRPRRALQSRHQAMSAFGATSRPSREPIKLQKKKIGRNDPCPCGSGRKYKNCCLNKDKDTATSTSSKRKQPKPRKRTARRRKRRK